jgi:hypothetical protein
MDPNTSLPFQNYNRKVKCNRLSNNTFSIMLKRKLRLPLFPTHQPPVICHNRRCKKQLDPWGDHLFNHNCFHKSRLHNCIRDTIHHVVSSLGPMAGLCHSDKDITIETPALVPGYPDKRPADVGIAIIPSTLSPKPDLPISTIAIDVTCPQVTFESSPNAATSQSHPTNKHLSEIHRSSIRTKFNGTSSGHTINAQYMKTLNETGTAIMPFTIDSFGAIGPTAHKFLCGSKLNPSEPEDLELTFTNEHATNAFARYKCLPTGIVITANANWKATTERSIDPKANPWTPLRWARQTVWQKTCIVK